MVSLARPRMTVEEFLDFAVISEGRYEYFYGEVFKLEAASFEHQQILAQLAKPAMNVLNPNGCLVLFAGTMVAADPKGNYTEPDMVIVCGKPQFTEAKRRALTNPRVLVEILSPTTQDYDRGQKFLYYRGIASLAEYLNVHQDQPRIEHHFRQPDGLWATRDIAGMDSILRFHSVPLEVPLRQIYEGVEFPEPAEG